MKIFENFVDTRMILAIVAFMTAYFAVRSVMKMIKNGRLNQEKLNKILSSDKYKVKGRFE